MGKIAAGLLTGNCVIVKPSPFTPYATLKFVELARDILPPGVLQALNGDGKVGTALTQHPGIQKISFTGSTATGKMIMQSAAGTLKRLTLELGGNDASVVCPDVNVDSVAREVAMGSFFHSGQMCVATKRVYVHKSIHDQFLSSFLQEVQNIKTATADGKPTTFGPVSNRMQFEVVKSYLQDCKKNGYNIVSGGTVEAGTGLWVTPTVVDRPPDDSLIVKGEQFG